MSFGGQGNGKAFFAVLSGQADVPHIDGVTFYVDVALENEFTQPSGEPVAGFSAANLPTMPLLPIQPISGGIVDAEVIAALAGALPEQRRIDLSTDATLSAATVAKLLSLGVAARDPDEEEKKWLKTRRGLFKQFLLKLIPADADFKVVVNRISPAQIAYVLDRYDRIFGPKQENKPHIETVFKDEFDKYVEKTNASDAGGFGDYLVKARRKDQEASNALAVISQFRELFSDLGKIGLTPREIEIAEDVMARSLDIEGLTPNDFLALVGAPRKPAPPPPEPPAAEPPGSVPSFNPGESVPPPPSADFSPPSPLPAPVGLSL